MARNEGPYALQRGSLWLATRVLMAYNEGPYGFKRGSSWLATRVLIARNECVRKNSFNDLFLDFGGSLLSSKILLFYDGYS